MLTTAEAVRLIAAHPEHDLGRATCYAAFDYLAGLQDTRGARGDDFVEVAATFAAARESLEGEALALAVDLL